MSEHRCKACGQILDGRDTLYGPYRVTPKLPGCSGGVPLPPAPLLERLSWYEWESSDDLNLVRAMVQFCWHADTLWASWKTLMAMTKLSRGWINILLHGCEEQPGERKKRKGLVERRILRLVAKASKPNRRPATYALNEGILQLDPRVVILLERQYFEAQQTALPMNLRPRPPRAGEPIQPAAPKLDNFTRTPELLPPSSRRELGPTQMAAAATVSQQPLPSRVPSSRRELAWSTTSTSLVHDVNQPGSRRVPEVGIDLANAYISSSATTIEVSEITAALREIVPTIDAGAVATIIAESLHVTRDHQPPLTTAELVHFVRQQGKVAKKRSHTPVGFLISTIPLQLAGDSLDFFRRTNPNSCGAESSAQRDDDGTTRGPATRAQRDDDDGKLQHQFWQQLHDEDSSPGWKATRDPWHAVLRWLTKKINRTSFDTWLAPTRFERAEGATLFVRVPNAEFCHIGDRYGDRISEAIDELQLGFTDVEFLTNLPPSKGSA